MAEFQRQALEALREPLETAAITIARAGRSTRFPADFQLVAAMNPCACGWLGHAVQRCLCSPDRIERYRAKLSGPFLDRLDIRLTLKVEEDIVRSTLEPERSVHVRRWGWSGRSVHRVRKVARTIADLAASASIETEHLALAIQYRG